MAEVKYGQDLVRALLRDQHPDLADLELRDVDGGWDNQQWRLGAELAVRLPRTERAPALLRTEQRWVPVLAERLPLPTPVPVRVGEPSDLFAHTWTVARWVEGEPADRTPISRPEAADMLARLLRALHHEAPADAPVNPTRSDPLAGARHGLDRGFELIADYPHADAARDVVDKALAAPAWRGSPVWLHGDLHPANLLVRDGALAAVIDFGDLTAGDPATDLSVAWMAFSPDDRAVFRIAYSHADDDTWTRARGWACGLALAFLAHSSDNPLMAAIGGRTLDAVLADDSP